MRTIPRDPIENVYKTTDDYLHAIEVVNASRTLYISGTMGLDAHGQPVEGLEAQLEQIWHNLKTILADAGMTTDNIVRLTSYLRSADYMQANEEARLRALGNHRVPTTTIVAITLQENWLMEIEAIAAA